MTRRKISVIVPTYDRPAMFRQALQSIRNIEAEGDDIEFEIVVGDNGPKEETRQTCVEFGALYAPAPGVGVSIPRNAAMKLASGEFLAFLDDDDAWIAGHIRPHLAYLDANPDIDAVFGQAIYADPNLQPYGEPWPAQHPGDGDELLRAMLSGLFPQVGTALFRRSVLDAYGYLDASLIGGSDWEWLLRMARARKLGHVAVPSVLFRGRPKGSYDALQRKRMGFARRIFLRHAMPEMRLWRSPLDLTRAYHGALRHFYVYFIEKARWDLENSRRGEAVSALLTLLANMPLLVLVDMVRPSEMRALVGDMARGRVRPLQEDLP